MWERRSPQFAERVAALASRPLHAAVTTSRANGIIFLGQSLLHHDFNRLAETEARFVVWGAEVQGQNYCSVGSDNLLGGRRAASLAPPD